MSEEVIEIWKDIPGFEGHYQVSNIGRVKSLDRTDRMKRHWPERMLSIFDDGHGYYKTSFYMNGKLIQPRVHRLVLNTFVGPRPEKGMHACHNNGNSLDNRLENLRWDTQKNNEADKILHGTAQIGEKNSQTHLTESDVLKIRELYSKKEKTPKELRVLYNISNSTVWRIIKREYWKHI